ncbi:MAG: DUF177 domain-containing protein [Gammaproteobacteria bacterium]|nr:DUF177 domain-containing protein [Gammaproteobacteria bacterium]
MSERLPDTVQYHELVERRSTVSGMVRVAELVRLSAAVLPGDERLAVELEFDREGRTSVMRGTIRGQLRLQCQRCLNDMVLPVDIELALALVHSEDEANRLVADLEPAIVPSSSTISLHELVEDEVLLVLPIVALHDDAECGIEVGQVADAAQHDEQPARPNPFAVLAGLKGKSTKH